MKRMLLLPAVLALVASACGGSAGANEGVASLDDTAAPDVAPATAAPTLSQEEALLAFTTCLREQGIDVPDPTMDADGNLQLERPAGAQQDPNFDRDAFRAAREVCVEHLEGVALGFRGEDRTETEDQLLAFAACVRENGYDMPDPDFSNTTPGQGGGGGPFGGLDRTDPAFQAAAEACSDLLPGVGRGVPGGPGGGGPSNDG
jgi:hypothetical protein